MAFGKFIGQEEIKRRLSVMMQGEPSQSFLFTGPIGSGKHTVASELARALVCSAPTPDGACGECECCRYYDAGTLPDVIRLEEDGNNIKVADVRRIVVAGSSTGPQIARRKVFLINCDKLNEEGQNAILKSVEEPPAGAVFILMSADRSHLLPTILSRVVEFKMTGYSDEQIRSIVRMRFPDIDSDRLGFITDFSGGLPGKAIVMAEDDEFSDLREKVYDMMITMPKKSYTDILYGDYAFMDENKSRIEDILVFMLWVTGDLAVMLKAPDTGDIRYKDKRDQMRKFTTGTHITSAALGRVADAISEMSSGMKVNVSYESACCSMLLKIYKEFKR